MLEILAVTKKLHSVARSSNVNAELIETSHNFLPENSVINYLYYLCHSCSVNNSEMLNILFRSYH
jgi:hypothetical protein